MLAPSANVQHMLKWLDLLKRINQYYRYIVIPTLDEAERVIDGIPAEILKRAQIVTSEISTCMEDTIGRDVAGVRSVAGSMQPSTDKLDSDRAGGNRDDDVDSDEEWMDVDDSFPTGDRRHGPVSVDDPNFGEKINLILNELVVINGENLL